MATPTDQELLDSAKVAIQKIHEGAQEYQISIPGGGTRTVRRGDLPALEKQVVRLEGKIAASTGSPIATLFVRMK